MEWHVPGKRNERSGRTIRCPAVSRFLRLTNYLVLGIVASALAIAMPVYFAPDGGWLVAKPAFAGGYGGGSGGGGGGSGGSDSGNSGNGGGNAGGAGGAGDGDGNNGNNGNNNNNGNNGNNAGGAGGGNDGTGGDDGTGVDPGATGDDGAASDVADDGASPPRQWLDDVSDELTDDELEAYVLHGDGASEAPVGASAIARPAVMDRDEEAQMIEAGWTALN